MKPPREPSRNGFLERGPHGQAPRAIRTLKGEPFRLKEVKDKHEAAQGRRGIERINERRPYSALGDESSYPVSTLSESPLEK